MERAHGRVRRGRPGEWGKARTWQEKATTYFREKQDAGMGPMSGVRGVLEEGERLKNGRRERDRERRRRRERENTSSGGESGYNVGSAGSASWRLTNQEEGPARDLLAEEPRIYAEIRTGRWFYTRDEKPKFLSNPRLSPISSFSLCFYTRHAVGSQETEETSEKSC